MSQVGRPISDVSSGSWGTLPLWSKLDEVTPDDGTTEIQTGSNPSNATAELLFSSLPDPATGTGHVLRIRAYTTNACTLAWSLYQGNTLIATCGTLTLSSSYATYAYNLTEAEADAISNYSDLRVRIVGNGAGRARVTWTEIEVPDESVSHSGSASISGGGSVLGTIARAAIVAALLSGGGAVAVSGQETFNAHISGGGNVAAQATKWIASDPSVPGGGALSVAVLRSAQASMPGVEDTFDRPDSEDLGPNWSVAGNARSFLIDTNAAVGSGGDSCEQYDAAAWPSDHISEIVLDSEIMSPRDCAPMVRIQTGSPMRGYIAFINSVTSITLYRCDNISYLSPYWTSLAENNAIPAFGAGSKIRLVATGSQMTLYVDGVQRIQATDATYSGGKPGIYAFSSASPAAIRAWTGKDAPLGAAVTGGGTVLVTSAAPVYGTAAVSGGGAQVVAGGKGGQAQSLIVLADDFNRADELPLGGPWTQVNSAPNVWDLSGQRISTRATSGSDVRRIEYPTYVSGAARQKITARFLAGGDFTSLIVGARGDGWGTRGYSVDAAMYWYRVYSPIDMLVGLAPWIPELSVGDVVGIEVEPAGDHTVVRIFRNGAVDATILDYGLTAPEDGRPRISTFFDGMEWDDFHFEAVLPLRVSGGGAIAAAGRMDAAAGITVSGGGSIVTVARKAIAAAVVTSGGGTVSASAREEARFPAAISGGGSVAVAIRMGARGRIIDFSDGGAIATAGAKGGRTDLALSGGGSVVGAAEANFAAGAWALIRGGGSLVAAGTRAAGGIAVVSGVGRLTVSIVRSWPYLAGAVPENTDAVAVLVRINLDYCGRTFGVAPCLATGEPCYNTWKTCRYLSAYQNVGRTYRFCSADVPQLFDDAKPYLTSVRWVPTEIKTNLTVNARVTVEMDDEPDDDVGIDPYWAQRSSHPGTYFKRLIARNVNYRGRTMEILDGRPGAPESTYTRRWIGRLENIAIKGSRVSIEAVDLLKDLAKIEVPPKVGTKLTADLTLGYTLGLSVAEDLDKLPSAGYVRIGDEIIRYESKDDVTGQLSPLSRAQFGTAEEDHSAKDKVQPVRYFEPKSGFDHLLDMILVDSAMDPAYVDTEAFAYYKEWPQRDIDFTAVVTEPKKLSDLFYELVDLLDCKTWVAENLKVTIRRNVQNAPGRSYHAVTDDDGVIHQSGSVDLNEKSRLTRVTVRWDKAPLGSDDDNDSYGHTDVVVDKSAEANYEGPVEQKILCRWIDPRSGEEGVIGRYVRNLGFRRITRCRDAQPLITVGVAQKDAHIATGDHVRLSTDELLDPAGNPIDRRIFQVVKRDRRADEISLTLIQVAARRICLIAPAGHPDYGAATEGEREYGFITDGDGKMSDGTEGYFIW